MNKRTKNILWIVFVIIALLLLARYVFFPEKFTERSEWLERIEDRQTQYKIDNPNATKEEMDQAFEAGINNLEARKEDYKANNPWATDADADQAFNEAWGK
jgi:uncharacterized protein YpmS